VQDAEGVPAFSSPPLGNRRWLDLGLQNWRLQSALAYSFTRVLLVLSSAGGGTETCAQAARPTSARSPLLLRRHSLARRRGETEAVSDDVRCGTPSLQHASRRPQASGGWVMGHRALRTSFGSTAVTGASMDTSSRFLSAFGADAPPPWLTTRGPLLRCRCRCGSPSCPPRVSVRWR